jgi:hypothetical protein
MSDSIVAILALLEDTGDGEGHQPLRGKREIKGERSWIVQRLWQIL